MSIRSVLKRSESSKTSAESKKPRTIPRRPARSSIAFCVACSREIKQLSVQALASMARVSVSSIERIERGERVSDEILHKVAIAVNQDEDAFTAKRIPLDHHEVEQALESWAAPYEGTTKVSVSHFTKQRQVRELSRCDAVLFHGSLLPDEAQPFLETLQEWIDLAGFIRATHEGDAFNRSEPFTRMREFNMDVLAAVREVERACHATALTGCYDAEWLCTDPTTATSNALPVKVGLVAFFPKETDPCAIKRQNLLVPRQIEF